ncbi:MAG TPA: metallophosphoesterase [Thermoanaerobaculia bacterium]|nr:metallophosphoesterase [Thermoanaerobaculia bacterium]
MTRIRTAVSSSVPRGFAFSAIWLGLFAYAGRPLLVAAHAIGVIPAIAWSALFALSLLPLVPFFSRRTRAANWIGYATLTVFAMLLLAVMMTDVVRLGYLVARQALDTRTISYTALATAGVLSIVGLFQARCPRIRRVSIPIENLPDALDGYRIAQLSDVHVGPTIQRRFVQSLVERTNAIGADAIAITGDLVDGHLDDLREQVEPLRELRARDGVFYVTGNHEYYWRASEWTPHLERLGLTFLKNAHRVIERGGAKIVFAGVTDPVGRDTHKQDPRRAMAGAPRDAVNVLLSHRPQTADVADRLGVDLQLSGHTHGGQFFPFNLIIRKFQPIVAGLHRVGRLWLYVNRGTGYWGPPSRLGVGGEITLIELTRA